MFYSTCVQIGLALTLSLASPAAAQEENCSHREIVVYVQDSKGQPLGGLVPADFESQMRGKPVRIVSVIPDTRPQDPKNPEVFMASLKTFELSLLDDYLIDIELLELERRYENWTIKLSKEKREQWKNARIMYAREIAPCHP